MNNNSFYTDYDSDSSFDSSIESIITDYDLRDLSDDDENGFFDDDSDTDIEEENLIGVNIAHSLILWALHFGISHTALTSLLMILRHYGHNELPKHAKTLLKTPRGRVAVRPCPPGEAFYFGIQNSLLKMDDAVFESMDKITTDFFIDGFSVSKSSNWQIWLILGSFAGTYLLYTRP